VAPSPTPQVALGDAIKQQRNKLGLSQEDLAHAARTSVRGLSEIETGHGNPTWDVAKRLARALGWSLAELALRADELETKGPR
jgi:ribosome-binding protein aMBF1 (putative translation factor)